MFAGTVGTRRYVALVAAAALVSKILTVVAL
jgi:hypothetical protein